MKKFARSLVLPAAFLCLFLLPLLTLPALAADVDVMFSDPSVKVGSTVSVNVYTDKDIAGITMTVTYDADYLAYTGFSGGLGSASVQDNGGSLNIVDYCASGAAKLSLNLNFTAKAVGTTVLRPSACMISDAGGDTMSVEYTSHSSTVKVTSASASSDARLSWLYIYPGTLRPAFSSDTTTYSVTVPYDTTWLAVTPELSDGDASFAISDNSLSVGSNTITVTVTAPNGGQRVYTLQVTRQTQNGSAPAASATPEASSSPSPSPTPTPSPTGRLAAKELSVEVLPAEDAPVTPDGCVIGDYTLNGKTYRAFLPTAGGEEYVILYGRTPDGEEQLYVYDLRDGTLQRYGLLPAPEAAPAADPAPDSTVTDAQIMKMRMKTGIFAAASAVLLVVSVLLAVALGQKKRK